MSTVKVANELFKNKKYREALQVYLELSNKIPGNHFEFNIKKCNDAIKETTLAETKEREIVKVQTNDKKGEIKSNIIKIAAILDRFSWMCWEDEADLIKITPDKWKIQLEDNRPELLFVESAWVGNDASWQYLISNSKRIPGKPLVDLIEWCNKNEIPTVFWNKEDPTDFEHFLNTARLFDIVCTTDENCIENYLKKLGHNRVFCLPFAAQPMLHNPLPLKTGRTGSVAFAGAWYNDRHDSRRIGAEVILKPAIKYGLEIYDRNHGKVDLQDRHGWPEEYNKSIVGGVPYEEMLNVYKKYNIFMNVNSVIDSNSMFSRRVYELLACGTPVISSYALGISKVFGEELVLMPKTQAETDEYLKYLLNNKKDRQELAEKGIKKVMTEHTYGHRLKLLIEKVNKFTSVGVAYDERLIKARRKIIPANTPALSLERINVEAFPDGPINRPNLNVGVIIDEIFEPYFKYEANLIKFSKNNWKEKLTKNKPHFLFVDSAWNGNDGEWAGHINRQESSKPSEDFLSLIKWCKEEKIPTVFWSREDPPNFDIFYETAAQCDYIYTTDLDCVERYRKKVGHDRVGVLPFAAQPRIHNPINVKGGRRYELVFGGTWYATKHPDRKVQMRTVIEPALEKGLHIYDRMLYYVNSSAYHFPENYRNNIAGTLNYNEMLHAMRQYKVMLNVNSVVHSPTMCSCRVIESLMCGSAVVSGYARGIANQLGSDLVAMPSTVEETKQAINTLLVEEAVRERLVTRAQRLILENHTCSHRFDQILTDLKLDNFVMGNKQDSVTVIVSTNRPDNIMNIVENFERQRYKNKKLKVILNGNKEYYILYEGILRNRFGEDAEVLYMNANKELGECLNLAISKSSTKYIAKMDDDDYYSQFYLTDQIAAFSYTDAEIVGKHSFLVYVEKFNKTYVRLSGRENSYQKFVCGATLLFKKSLFDNGLIFPTKSLGEDSHFLEEANKRKIKIYSTSKYNFMCYRHLDHNVHTWNVDSDEYLEKLTYQFDGLDYSKVTA